MQKRACQSTPCSLFLVDDVTDDLCDVGLCELERVEQLPCGTAVAELVLHADSRHLDGTFCGDNLADRVGETADDVVLLNGDDSACLLRRLDDDVAVDGLDGVDVDESCTDALSLQLLDCLERLVDDKTGGDDGDVIALVERDALAQLKAVGLGIVEAVDRQSASSPSGRQD